MAKLTRKQKIEIYERRLNGETIKSLSNSFNINESNIKYLIKLISKHGYNILRKDKNKYYPKTVKESIINRVLFGKESIEFVSIDFGLSSSGILHNWIKKYKENCYNVIEKKKGRKTMTKIKKTKKTLTKEETIKELEKENLYLKAEIEYLKKLNALVQKEEQQKNKKLK